MKTDAEIELTGRDLLDRGIEEGFKRGMDFCLIGLRQSLKAPLHDIVVKKLNIWVQGKTGRNMIEEFLNVQTEEEQ